MSQATCEITAFRPGTQCGNILQHLRTNRSLNQWQAIRLYGVMRLASRITDLRKAGYIIGTERCVDHAGHRFTSYFLAA